MHRSCTNVSAHSRRCRRSVPLCVSHAVRCFFLLLLLQIILKARRLCRATLRACQRRTALRCHLPRRSTGVRPPVHRPRRRAQRREGTRNRRGVETDTEGAQQGWTQPIDNCRRSRLCLAIRSASHSTVSSSRDRSRSIRTYACNLQSQAPRVPIHLKIAFSTIAIASE